MDIHSLVIAIFSLHSWVACLIHRQLSLDTLPFRVARADADSGHAGCRQIGQRHPFAFRYETGWLVTAS
jgi:hypothetical protein